MSTDEIAQLNVDIKEAKKTISLAADAKKLKDTRAFKNVILEHYFKNYVIHLVMLKGSIPNITKEQKEGIDEALLAVSTFNNFIEATIEAGSRAEYNLSQSSAALVDALEEE